VVPVSGLLHRRARCQCDVEYVPCGSRQGGRSRPRTGGTAPTPPQRTGRRSRDDAALEEPSRTPGPVPRHGLTVRSSAAERRTASPSHLLAVDMKSSLCVAPRSVFSLLELHVPRHRRGPPPRRTGPLGGLRQCHRARANSTRVTARTYRRDPSIRALARSASRGGASPREAGAASSVARASSVQGPPGGAGLPARANRASSRRSGGTGTDPVPSWAGAPARGRVCAARAGAVLGRCRRRSGPPRRRWRRTCSG
jgi:hypothetical protein